MTQVLQEQESRFKILGEEEGSYCQVDIAIKTLRYQEGGEYYELLYHYEYGASNPHMSKILNPFTGLGNPDLNGGSGDIVAKNDMTKQMVRHLLMDDTELAKVSGHIFPCDYKAHIMRSLALFWD